MGALAVLRPGIQLCVEAGDYATRELFECILAEARHCCALDAQGNGAVQAVDTALIHALPIMEVAWCRVKIGAGWSSALGLVEFYRHAKVGRTLRCHLDVIG